MIKNTSYCDLYFSGKYSNKILVFPSGPMQSPASVEYVCNSLISIATSSFLNNVDYIFCLAMPGLAAYLHSNCRLNH